MTFYHWKHIKVLWKLQLISMIHHEDNLVSIVWMNVIHILDTYMSSVILICCKLLVKFVAFTDEFTLVIQDQGSHQRPSTTASQERKKRRLRRKVRVSWTMKPCGCYCTWRHKFRSKNQACYVNWTKKKRPKTCCAYLVMFSPDFHLPCNIVVIKGRVCISQKINNKSKKSAET